MLTYSNPTKLKTVENWPNGGSKRCTAYFSIETGPKGERAVRRTTGAAKKLTYSDQQRIVEGSDGRTYIACLSHWGHITIKRGDMKFEQETIFPGDERFAAVRALFFFDPPPP